LDRCRVYQCAGKDFQNEHLNTKTSDRFAKFKLNGLFVTGKISPSLIVSLLEAEELMTDDERDDVVLQKSLINRAFNLLRLWSLLKSS
jgi:hypothetical protein